MRKYQYLYIRDTCKLFYRCFHVQLCFANQEHRGHANAGARHQDVCRRHPKDSWASRPGKTPLRLLSLRSLNALLVSWVVLQTWLLSRASSVCLSRWAVWTPHCVQFSWKFFWRINQRESNFLWRRWVSKMIFFPDQEKIWNIRHILVVFLDLISFCVFYPVSESKLG